jgi:hypothetical protein
MLAKYVKPKLIWPPIAIPGAGTAETSCGFRAAIMKRAFADVI